MSEQRERAETLRALHRRADPLVLVNVWDAASARVVAATPGCRAIATASWAIAAAHGFPDGEAIGRDAMLAAVAEIAAAVPTVPVTADLEGGYGATPSAVGETVGGALAVGVVGCNLEDGTGDAAAPLRDAAEHAERVAAARAAGEAAGVPVVINARTDVYLAGAGPADERLGMAIERGRAYLEAGADCIFVPGVADLGLIDQLVRGVRGQISVLAGAGGPTLAELARAGVARVSYGPGPHGAALAALRATAVALLAGERPPEALAFRA
jgi:2-methylisocitrate lyase-like PEP mutase family enzyme